MTPAEFKNAIRKGQGRVIQCLRNRSGEVYVNLIEHACTHELAYDAQCEGSRAEYMMEIVSYVGGLKRFRNAILARLETTDDFWDCNLLFHLARQLASEGDSEARTRMRSRYQSQVGMKRDFPGALDIIELDGMEGLRFVAATIGAECQRQPDYWPADVRWFTNEVFAEGQIKKTLEDMAKHDVQVQAYVNRLNADDSCDRSSTRPTNEELERMPFDALMSHTALGTSIVGPYMLTRWGKAAPDAELAKAAVALAEATDPPLIKLLLGAFRYRPFPHDPRTLLGLLEQYAEDRTISRRVETALQIVKSPVVRAAALRYIHENNTLARGLDLLCANYKDGDADQILQLLPSVDDDAEYIHDIGHALLDLFDDERISAATDAYVWMWEHTPCSICRHHAFERLDSIGCVPDWMRAEAALDCYPSLRKLARNEPMDDE